jgi:anti-sigma regulatory factor (Ser/Thr protein kinase)
MPVQTAFRPTFSVRLPATAQSVPILRAQLREWLTGNDITQGAAFDLILACSECLAIAIEEPLRPVALIVEVGGKIDGELVTIAVRDYGLCREEREQPGETLGMLLIEALVDTVDVQTHPDGNTLTLCHQLRSTSRRRSALVI